MTTGCRPGNKVTLSTMKRLTALYNSLGPGILFAAAAIGVSHLVQSTRAGAEYGLALIPLLLLACAAKYPSLLFGLLYPASTGKSLLENYRDQGWWAFAAYALVALYSMWFILAAVAVTTAGLWQALFGQPGDIVAATALVIGLALIVLLSGQLSGLEHLSKIMLGLLAILLPAATVLVLPAVDFSASAWVVANWDIAAFFFVIALSGWMPIPSDAAVVSSAWAASREHHGRPRPSPAAAALDFNVGFLLSVAFALCFVLLGAGMLYGSGQPLPAAAGPFAGQVIQLFTSQFGEGSYYLIAVIAFITMFSTLLTVLDGQMRIVAYAVKTFRPSVTPSGTLYKTGLLIYAAGGVTVVAFFMQSFTTFISFVTSLGFLIAPVIVVLNHRAMFNADVPPAQQPSRTMYWWSVIGGAMLIGCSAAYFYLRLQT